MKKNKKYLSIILGSGVVLLAAILLATVFIIYQRGNRPITPTAPESRPAAAETCALAFRVDPSNCNEPCSSNAQCDRNLQCDEKTKTCQPTYPAISECTDDGLVDIYFCDRACETDVQCKSIGPDYSCIALGRGSRCRLTRNPSSSTCEPPITETDTEPEEPPIVTTYACNSNCTADAQCQTISSAYTCVTTQQGGKCRLIENPTSAVCDTAGIPPITEVPEIIDYSCNSSCTANEQCQSVNLDYACVSTANGDRCRHIDNPTSNICQLPAVEEVVNQYFCNSECETDQQCQQDLGSEYSCESDGSGSYCRLTTNPSSPSCNYTYACNAGCQTDAQCQTIGTEYSCEATAEGNRCRLTDNPEEPTCVLDFEDTVTYSCDTSCQTDAQCQEENPNYICDISTQTCRLEDNPSSDVCWPIYACNASCESDAQCQTYSSDYICYQNTGTCRHQDYPDLTNCVQIGGPLDPTPDTTTDQTESTLQSSPVPSPTSNLIAQASPVATPTSIPTTQPTATPRPTSNLIANSNTTTQTNNQAETQPDLPEELPESGAGEFALWSMISLGVILVAVGLLIL